MFSGGSLALMNVNEPLLLSSSPNISSDHNLIINPISLFGVFFLILALCDTANLSRLCVYCLLPFSLSARAKGNIMKVKKYDRLRIFHWVRR